MACTVRRLRRRRRAAATTSWFAFVLSALSTGCSTDSPSDQPSAANSPASAQAAMHAATPSASPARTWQSEVKESVGPLFPASGQTHSCTAAVVAGSSRNIVMTAAHCLSGSALGMRFMPGYTEGATPHGIWIATGAYADARWLRNQDPRFDYAFLRVAPDSSGRALEDSVAGLRLVTTAPAKQPVTVVGYGTGSEDEALVCGGLAHDVGGGVADAVEPDYLEFDCGGFVGGTSGSPLIISPAKSGAATLIGLIGGLHQGGCTDAISYSPLLTADTAALLQRAGSSSVPDVFPSPPLSDC